MEKIDPIKILRAHFETFGNVNGKKKWYDIITFYFVPLVIGYFSAMRCFSRMISECVSYSVTVLSIFIPLAFALLSQLAALQDRESVKSNKNLGILIRQLYANILYGILAATVTLTAILALKFFGFHGCFWLYASFSAIMVHLLLTLLMVLKRFSTVMDHISSK